MCKIVAHTQQYKRTTCSSRANPPPAFNKRRSMRSRHRHCNVFEQRMMMVTLRPHTASNTTHNIAQFKQHKRTRCSSRDNTTPFDTFNNRRFMQSHHHHCNVFGQRMRVRLRLHTASNTDNTAQFKQYGRDVRAVCSEPPNTTFVLHIQRTEINACASEWDCDLILHRSPITCVKTSNIRTKRTYCSIRANTTPIFIQSTDEDQFRAMHSHCSVRDGEITTSCTLCRSLTTPPNSSTHAVIQTYALIVQRQQDTRSIYSTNEWRLTQSRYYCT